MILLAGILFIAGCSYHHAEELEGVCSTNNVSYTATIAPLLQANGCVSCHNGPNPEGGVNLGDYSSVMAKAMEMRGGISVLYGAVNHMQGFSAMPKGLPMISNCDISKLKAWIDAGMPQ